MTELVVPYFPRKHFIDYHNRVERFAAIVAHRRFGKTVGVLNDTSKRALECMLPDPRYAYVAPMLKQSKVIAWNYLKKYTRPIWKKPPNESELYVTLLNDAVVQCYGSDNPDSLRGVYFDGVILDESAQMKGSFFEEIIRATLADRKGWCTWIGSAKGRDAFYNVCRKAQTTEGWFFRRFRASETGILSAEELADFKASVGPNVYAREMECSFDEPDVAQLISGDSINVAMSREPYGAKPIVIGVDPARFGDDRSIAIIRKGDTLLDVKVWRGIDTMQLASHVGTLISAYKPDGTFIDDIGVGGGVVDRLKSLSFNVMGVNVSAKAMDSTKYHNLRAECWDKMKMWVENRASLPKRDDVADDLASVTYSFDGQNRIQLESKDSMRKRGLPSPDIGDALSLTFAYPVAWTGTGGASTGALKRNLGLI